MPLAEMVTVGGPDGAGVGDGVATGGGVGAVGVDAGLLPEQAAVTISARTREI